MRRIFILAFLISTISVKAQTAYPVSIMDYMHPVMFGHHLPFNDSVPNKKWSVTTYASISSSISFFKGGHATVLAVPLVLQLNRRLTNNWYAFAAVSAAPAYVNFSSTNTIKSSPYNGFMQPGKLGIYSKAELGLMYVNDAKTFSISGSIGVTNSSQPALQYYPVNTNRPNAVLPQRR